MDGFRAGQTDGRLPLGTENPELEKHLRFARWRGHGGNGADSNM